ncbi:MAG: hypothetical protein JWP26_3956 [Devosia sp.]|nr:hypothetical protein [Devosia sp.]MDB5588986.1 hypothetical protein [Devosia sp.]
MRWITIGVLLTLVVSSSSAYAQDRSPPADASGKGPVLCVWGIYQLIDQHTRKCGWVHNAVDSAVEAGIAKMDAFIIENSSTPVSQQTLDEKKLTFASQVPDNACAFKPGDGSFTSMIWGMRQGDPATVTSDIAELLSVPREPLMNPCL